MASGRWRVASRRDGVSTVRSYESFYASLTEGESPARLLLVTTTRRLAMRWRIEGSLAVLLALGGCAQDPAHQAAPDRSQDADDSVDGRSRDADTTVDADAPRSVSADESVANPTQPPRPHRRRVATAVAIETPTHATATEDPSVAPRAEVAAAERLAVTRASPAGDRAEPADVLGAGRRAERPDVPRASPSGEQAESIAAHCARLRSLPSWCVERERARVRKRGTP